MYSLQTSVQVYRRNALQAICRRLYFVTAADVLQTFLKLLQTSLYKIQTVDIVVQTARFFIQTWKFVKSQQNHLANVLQTSP